MTHHLRDPKDLPAECFTIDEFCRTHRIGRTKYYELREEGRGPDEFPLGDKWLITKEAAARWRAAREAEAKKDN